jgi:L-amino acid N-acyltransferase YncA
VQIRAAQDPDWPQIWAIFSEVVEAGETYAYPWPMTSAQAQQLWLEVPPGLTIVAVDGEEVLGTAKMGPNRPGRGSHVATASFMVATNARGRGVGRALAEYFIDWAGRGGYGGLQFNAVVETNTAAVRLWQQLGFTIVGTVPAAFDHRVHGLVGLHVMYRAVTPRFPPGR